MIYCTLKDISLATPLIEAACQIARGTGMLVVLDLASYNVVESNLGSFKNIVTNYVDILFANEQEARAYTGFDPDQAFPVLSEACEVVILKLGAEGSWIRKGEEMIKISAFPVKCNDTTGAGDLYAAGFLLALQRDSTWKHVELLAHLWQEK
jgi:sugar/nucleoside kinase (ribokinase family)